MGTCVTLGDLQHTPKAPSSSTVPKKEIMRTHAFDANAVHAGMMVVYGSDPSAGAAPAAMNGGGGIPASVGFGAGAGMYRPHPYGHHPGFSTAVPPHNQQSVYASATPGYAGY
jgi:hypothetical protein